MVKKMGFGGKNRKKKISAKAQALMDAQKSAEAEAAKQARVDAMKQGVTNPEELRKIENQARLDAKKGLTAKDGMKVYKSGGAVKPDFIDIDGDGNKKESMKEAAKGNNQAYKGMKIKKAKGGMKVYNNGGKEDPKKLATPEEIKESRRGSQRRRTSEQKEARKDAKKQAKIRARKGGLGTGNRLVKTATTDATGPESLTSGQVRRRGRRLERAAKRAGLTKADAYDRSEYAALESYKKADADKKKAEAAGDKKGERKAKKQINRLSRVEKAQQRYEGIDKKRAIIPVKSKLKKEIRKVERDEKKEERQEKRQERQTNRQMRRRRAISSIKKGAKRPPSGPMPGSKKRKGVEWIDLNFPGGGYTPGGPGKSRNRR